MPTISFPYQSAVNPPGPFVSATIETLNGSTRVVDHPAQIDTAADWTVLPQSTVDQLQLSPTRQVPLQGFGGAANFYPVYEIILILPRFKPLRVEVVAQADERWMLLGRTVLNQFRIVLDGPSLKVIIEEP